MNVTKLFFKLSLFTLSILQHTTLQAQACGTDTIPVTAITGSISDGSGINDYENNLDCTWLLQAEAGERVLLDFTAFDLQANCCDFIQVYDGNSTSANFLGTFYSPTLPNKFFSSGEELFIRFRTNSSVTASGWEATVVAPSDLLEFTYSNVDVLAGSGNYEERIYSTFSSHNISTNVAWLTPSVSNDTVFLAYSLNETAVERVAEIYIESGLFADTMTISQAANLGYPNISSLSLNGNTSTSILSKNFSLGFTRNTQVNTGSIRLFRASDDLLIDTVDVNNLSTGFRSFHYPNFTQYDTLQSGTAYYILIDSGAFIDEGQNIYAGLLDKTAWTFSTRTNSGQFPEFTNKYLDESYTVNVTNTLFYFQTPYNVEPGTGNIRLYRGNDDSLVATIDASTISTGISTYHDWFFEGYDSLDWSTEYYILIDSGAVVDVFGNAYKGNDKNDWTFFTQTNPVQFPVVANLSYDEQDDVEISSINFSMSFTGSVRTNNIGGSIKLYKSSDSSLIATELISSLSSSYRTTHSWNFDDYELLEASTEYFVLIDSGAFVDQLDNAFEGILDSSVWTFTTTPIATEFPTVTLLSRNKETSISIENGRYFNIQFDAPVKEGSGNIYLYKTSNDSLVATENISSVFSTSHAWNFDGYVLLEPATDYHILIDNGAYVDAFDNAFEGITSDTTWTFTTEPASDEFPVNTFRYRHNNTTVSVTDSRYFYMQFSSSVKPNAGNIYLYKVDNDSLISTVNASSLSSNYRTSPNWNFDGYDYLEGLTEYYILIDSGFFEDTFGNYYGGLSDDSDWTFTTAVAPPFPATAALEFDQEDSLSVYAQEFSITFDADATPAEGKVYLYQNSNDSLWASVDVSTLSSDFDTKQSWTFSDYSNLDSLEDYYILIDNGAFKNVYHSSFEGISDKTTWTFRTGDLPTAFPLVTELYQNGSNDAALSNDFYIEFDGNVSSGTGNIRLFQASDDLLVDTKDVSTGSMSFGNTYAWTFDGFNYLPKLSEYYILVDSGAIVDPFGNASVGITDSTIWTFTTGDKCFEQLEITSTPTVFEDGSGPNNYANNLDCGWFLEASAGEQIVFSFNNFDLRTSDDYVRIYDGLSNAAPLLGEFLGRELPGSFLSTGNQLYVEFITNGFSTRPGWEAQAYSVSGEVLTYTNDKMTVSSVGGTFSQQFITNMVGVSVSSNQSWAQPVISNDTVTVSYTANETVADRVAEITIESGEESDVFTLTQKVNPGFPVTTFLQNNGGTQIDVTQKYFRVIFERNVRVGSGFAHLYKTDGDELVESVNVLNISNATFSGTSHDWEFNYDTLNAGTSYYVQIDAGAFIDEDGNNVYVGLSDKTEWTFSTRPNTGRFPDFTNKYLDDQFTVAITNTLFYFRTPYSVEPGVGNITLYRSSDDSLVATVNASTISTGTSTYHDWFFEGYDSLDWSTEYYILIDSGAVVDVFGNAYKGNDKNDWTFFTQTDPLQFPVAANLSYDEQDDVEISSINFSMSFTGSVRTNNIGGSIRLYKSSDNSLIATELISSLSSSYRTTHSWNFDGYELLEAATEYFVLIDSGAFADQLGNAFEGILDSSVWTFTTRPITTEFPAVTLLSRNKETSLAIENGRYFNIQFDAPVKTGSGSIYLYKTSNDSLVSTLNPSLNFTTSYAWNFSGYTLLEPTTDYHILIDNGAFVDAFDNTFEGILSDTTWTFTTEPASVEFPVNTFRYRHNNTSVSVTDSRYFYMQFSASVKPNAGNIYLYKVDNDSLISTVNASTLSSNYRTSPNWNFDGYNYLEGQTDYYILIDENFFVDVFGNFYSGLSDDTEWTFTTAAAPAFPAITTLEHEGDDSLSVYTQEFSITFADDARPGEGNIYLYQGDNDSLISTVNVSTLSPDFEITQSWTFSDYSNLDSLVDYYILIDNGAFKNIYHSPFEGISDKTDWTFTTGDLPTVFPTITELYQNGSNDAALLNDFFIEFDGNVSSGTGNIYLFEGSTDSLISTKDVSTGSTSFSSTYAWTFDDFSYLPKSTAYYILVDSGAIVDPFGNAFVGITDSSIWAFSTGDRCFEQLGITSTPTVFEDGSGTSNYANNLDCGWFLEASAGDQIVLSFNNFDLRTSGDYVRIYDGTSNAAPLLGEFLGNELPGSFLSSGNQLYVEFITNSFSTRQGWEAQAYAVSGDVLTFVNDKVTVSSVSGEIYEQFITNMTGVSVITDQLWADATVSNDTIFVNYTANETVADRVAEITIVSGAESDMFTLTQEFNPGFPDITSLQNDGATQLELTQRYFRIIFDRNVRVGSGSVHLYKTDGDELVESINVANISNASFSSTSHDWNFNYDTLNAGTSYYILIDAGAFIDEDGDNVYTGLSDKTEWTFSTRPNTGQFPDFTIKYLDESYTVGITNSYFYFRTPYNVEPGVGNIRLYRSSDDMLIATEDASTISSGFTTNHDWNFDGYDSLDRSTEYYILIDSGAITDVFGNTYKGNDKNDWTFFTQADPTQFPVTVDLKYNKRDDVSIAEDAFSMSFTGLVRRNNIGGSIRLYKSSDSSLIATELISSLSSSNRTTHSWNFDGYELLEASTKYFILIDSGAFVDQQNNAFVGILDSSVWTFTTEPITTEFPAVTLLSRNKETSVAIDNGRYFNIQFEAPVKSGSGNIYLYKTSDNSLVSTRSFSTGFTTSYAWNFSGYTLLEPATDYHILIDNGAFVDAFDNAFEGISSDTAWTFRTEAASTEFPTVTTLYRDGSTNLGIDETFFYIRFDDNIVKNEGNIYLYRRSNDSLVSTIDVSSLSSGLRTRLNWNFSGYTFLEASTDYYILVDQGAFTDVFGNTFEGISDKNKWTFTTEEAAAEFPNTTFLYRNTDVGVNIDDARYFYMNFSEQAEKATGNIYLYKSTNDQLIATEDVTTILGGFSTSRDWTFDGYSVLEPLTEYYILIDQGAFTDIFGNEFDGISDKTIWTFTTGDGCVSFESIDREVTLIEDGSGIVNYEDNLSCFWQLNAAVNEKIVFKFTSIDTEQGVDVISVYDGPDQSSTLLGTYSGVDAVTTDSLVSSSNRMFIRFTSNASTNASGWEAQAYTLSSVCSMDYEFNATMCEGGTYVFGDSVLDTPGVYVASFTSQETGCDSTVTLTLIEKSVSTRNISKALCPGTGVFFGGQSLSEAGVYRDTVTTSLGCDSILVLTLTVLEEGLDSCLPTALEEDTEELITNPNPFSEVFEVQGLGVGTKTLTLYNLNGTIAWETVTSREKLRIEPGDIPAGVYTLIIDAENGTYSAVKVVRLP